MAERVQPEQRDIHHVGEPRQGMPVGGVARREGPADARPRSIRAGPGHSRSRSLGRRTTMNSLPRTGQSVASGRRARRKRTSVARRALRGPGAARLSRTAPVNRSGFEASRSSGQTTAFGIDGRLSQTSLTSSKKGRGGPQPRAEQADVVRVSWVSGDGSGRMTAALPPSGLASSSPVHATLGPSRPARRSSC